MQKSNIGVIGLAVMGENLVINMANHGYTVCVYNRTAQVTTDFINGRAKGLGISGVYNIKELAMQLEKPRKIMLMVKAGVPVDELIEQLIPTLESGDIIIDGGNSHFKDTERRTAYVESHGLLYIGTGVSGGEEGALKGPSIMPGGSEGAWQYVKPIFQAIAAKTSDGNPCCEWVGTGGAGHFVKMIHNGIEYGDMQLICETYQLLRDGLGLTAQEMHQVFAKWNEGKLESYLIGITADILTHCDTDGLPIIDKILDTAGQKGTGIWTVNAALEEGIALTLIGEAVFSRFLSSIKEQRVFASTVLTGPPMCINEEKNAFIDAIGDALYASKIISYAQGFALIQAAAQTYGWVFNYGDIALMWRGGCIIRSVFLNDIKNAFDKNPNLSNLMLDEFFSDKLLGAGPGWRKVLTNAILAGISTPAMYSALAYFDGYRCSNLPVNLLQAQRDYFGAHTFERIDSPRGKFFHFNWQI